MLLHLYLYKKIILQSDVYKHLLGHASNYSRKNILKKNTYSEKCTSLINDFLLRELIYKNYGFDYDKNEIITNTFGKPLFKKNSYYFNFSHNEKYGVLLLGKNPVGVDIEETNNLNIGTKSFFVSDQDYLHKINLKLALCKLWTGKESYCKAIGCGLNIPLKQINVIKKGGNLMIKRKEETQEWFIKHIILPNKTIIAICSVNQFSLEYNEISISEYLSKILN